MLGDNHGNLVHLYERDCSVQRRHQKVVEYAPAWSLPEALRARLAAGRAQGRAPRALHQRRHRRVPGRRGRQPLLHRGQPAHPGRAHGDRGDHGPRPRAGADPHRAGLQAVGSRDRHPQPGSRSSMRGVAIQVRVTAEDPKNDFLPDTGKISVYRPAVGLGIRLDDGSGYVGARVSPFYDSLLAKITASGLEWNYARRKAIRVAARVPHPRRQDQHPLPRERARAPDVRRRQGAHDVRRRDAGAGAVHAAPRSRDAHPALRGVDGGQRPPHRARQAQAAAGGAERPSRRCRTCRPRSPRRRRRPARSRSSTQRGPEGRGALAQGATGACT